MRHLIPPFDWQRVLVQPWMEDFSITVWIVLMGFFVTAACGLVGNYLVLRRMALVGDAISHSILPGLVVAFLLFKHVSVWVSFAGALAAAALTVVLIEFIHKQSRVKPDSAICITFTTLFALGVVLMSMLETKGAIHIDAECVLYGEIAFVSLEPPAVWNGWELGPPSVLRMAAVLAAVALAIFVFYKELLVTAFDAGLAKSLGMRVGVWHYGLMGALAIVVVSAFESVGAILAVAMLIVPPMFAGQLSDRLSARLGLTVLHAALSALIGLHLSVWLNCSAAGAMVVAAALLFVAVWPASPIGKLLRPSLRGEAPIFPGCPAGSRGQRVRDP
ncbi:MAG: metal ABC transporter permease [Terrimicrobiaceae bacterium]|nr:metal ABC transporter permease [Terrimicrobiaceae bacterium]